MKPDRDRSDRIYRDGSLLWCVVHTNPGAEQVARMNLKDEGLEVLYPYYTKIVRPQNRPTVVMRPVFPRYVFAGHEDERRFVGLDGASGVRGVNKVVSVASTLVLVPRRDIDKLRSKMLNDDGLCDEPEWAKIKGRDRFDRGAKVQIVGGPFRDHPAIVVLDSEKAIRVWVDLFARRTELDLDPIQVEKA